MAAVNSMVYDCIVAGSGPAGTMCAQTLAEAGRTVLMLDGGVQAPPIADITASTLHDYRTGSDGDALPHFKPTLQWKQTGAAEQLTAARRYVVEQTANWLPVVSPGFQLMESLAYGGLGAAWGLGCYRFTDEELQLCELPVQEMTHAYETVAQRIGISYTPDDIDAFVMNNVSSLQSSINLDDNARLLFSRYELQKHRLNEKGFYIGRPPLALLTSPLNGRNATDYSNLDFYINRGQAAWRPSVTLDKLRGRSNFHYLGECIVSSFTEENEMVKITAMNIRDHSHMTYQCKKLAICCGATGTARIAMRSFSFYGQPLPLLSNPYAYVTALQLKRLGKTVAPYRTSTAQLAVIQKSENPGEDGMASLYSYDALPMSNVLRQVPVGFRDGRVLMQYLLPAIVIAGIHHPDRYANSKYIQLIKKDNSPTGDALEVHFELSPAEEKEVKLRTRRYRNLLRSVGCLPVKTVRPPNGSSIHYAGTLPFDTTDKQLTTHPDGRLAGTRQVFIADGSPFHFLPAKGLTFTIMANAHRTALQLLKNE